MGGFQDLTISSAPHASVKYSTTADSSTAEEFLPPSTIRYTGKYQNIRINISVACLVCTYSPNISVEQYTIADILPAEGNLSLPYIKKYTGKEREISSPCSHILIETYVPKVLIKHSASADVPPAEEDICVLIFSVMTLLQILH